MAGLTIVSTANTSTTTPGSVVVYTTTLANTGQTPYFGISVNIDGTGLAGDATGNGDQTASSGTLSVGTTGAVWTGDIPVGGTVTLTGSVTVDNPDTGSHVLALVLISAAAGSNCPAGGTDPRCSPVVDVLVPALSIVTTADTAAAVPGQTVSYTLTVTDHGQTPYAGATVTATLNLLDDATYHHDAAAASGTVSYASPVITWTGDLAVGASAVITWTVTVNNPDTGDKNLATVAASADPGSSCPPGSSTAGCTLTVPVLTPALTIVKTAATTSGSNAVATPGGVVTYTITVTNTGQAPYTGAGFTDPLSGVPDDAAYNNDAAATRRDGQLHQPHPVLGRGPGARRGRGHHLYRHREQPRYRRRLPDQYRDLGHARQQLPGRRRRCPLHRHGHRGRRVHADVHPDRGGRLRGGRPGGALHHHHRQLRDQPVQRRGLHRPAGRGDR